MSLLVTGSAGAEPAATQPAQPAADPRIISWFDIGTSSPDLNHRRVGWNLKNRGWARFVEEEVRPQLQRGVRRVMVHNPFGTLSGEPMQFDQAVHAHRDGHAWLLHGFAEAWYPVTQGVYTNGEPVEVIGYLGRHEQDPSFEFAQDRPGGAGWWLARAQSSLRPVLAAEMSVGFDASSNLARESPEYRLIQLVQALDTPIYLEARPYRNRRHLFGLPVITTESFWNRSDPAKHQDARALYAPNDALTGEIIRILVQTDSRPDKRVEQARRVLRDGHTVAVQLGPLFKAGYTLNSLQP